MLLMTRRTFDLWLTIAGGLITAAVTLGAVALGAHLALRRERQRSAEDARVAAVVAVKDATRYVRELLQTSRGPDVAVGDITPKNVHSVFNDVSARRHDNANRVRSAAAALDHRIVDGAKHLPRTVVDNRERIYTHLDLHSMHLDRSPRLDGLTIDTTTEDERDERLLAHGPGLTDMLDSLEATLVAVEGNEPLVPNVGFTALQRTEEDDYPTMFGHGPSALDVIET